MQKQDPREYGKLIRDPVHSYVAVPNELVPLVRSPYVQRLRSISQNSRASAAYPSMNGTRYEHALGTMHLSITAWSVAWANVWGPVDDGLTDSIRNEFMIAAAKSVAAELATAGHIPDPTFERLFQDYDGNVRTWKKSAEWFNGFPEWIAHAIGAVGLLHDIGHPPFSHVLEDVYERHADVLLSPGTRDLWETYQLANTGESTQFHEFAGSEIVSQILRDHRLVAQLSPTLISLIFRARTGSSWASCIHGLIDGQIDVDRLDYIIRDSMRAGTEYHAMDRERLLGNLELHKQVRPGGTTADWSIGVGIRGISALEALLLQRDQSYRWMIFHPQALIADTCLKRAFDEAISAGNDLPFLDYIGSWSADNGQVAQSYRVDDHRVTEWLREVRAERKGDDASDNRFRALMSTWDEFSDRYVPVWRNFGEFVEALRKDREFNQLLLDKFQRVVAEYKLQPIQHRYRENIADIERLIQDADGTDGNDNEVVARLFRLWIQLLEDSDSGRTLTSIDEQLESLANQAHSEIGGVKGTWIVAHRLKFQPIKKGKVYVWKGNNERVFFKDISPIYTGLVQSDQMRPALWAFFVPLADYGVAQARNEPRREDLRALVASRFIDVLKSFANAGVEADNDGVR